MQVISLGSRAAGPWGCDVAGLVDVVGLPCFPRTLFSFARTVCRAEHLTAFVDGSGRMRTILAENAGAGAAARQRAGRYEAGYWRLDPAEAASSDLGEGECRLMRSAAGEIRDTAYRDDCYGSVQLDQRVSLAERRGARRLRLNFYRRQGEAFVPDEVSQIVGLAEVLMSLVRRHDEAASAARGADLEAVIAPRLAAAEPALSRREREVCTLVILGLSSEGIALRLSLSLNTVLTYRKRAYARLGITSQNELMRRVLA